MRRAKQPCAAAIKFAAEWFEKEFPPAEADQTENLSAAKREYTSMSGDTGTATIVDMADIKIEDRGELVKLERGDVIQFSNVDEFGRAIRTEAAVWLEWRTDPEIAGAAEHARGGCDRTIDWVGDAPPNG
jgi:hypothetical protein